MRIVGLDLSTTNTGVAVVHDGQLEVVTNVKSQSKDWSSDYSGRFNRLQRTVKMIIDHCRGADMVVIEGPSYGSHTSGTWDRAGLFWTVYGAVSTCGWPVGVVPPTVRAKYATGKGGAGKAAVAVACGRLFPEADIADDNAADAVILAAMGAHWLGHPVAGQSLRVGMGEILRSAEWPVLL